MMVFCSVMILLLYYMIIIVIVIIITIIIITIIIIIIIVGVVSKRLTDCAGHFGYIQLQLPGCCYYCRCYYYY